jgi:hypothetical protein
VDINLSSYLFYKGVKFAPSQSWRQYRWGAQENKALDRTFLTKREKACGDF